MHVLVGNLAPETTADDLKTTFAAQEIEVSIEMHHEGDPNRLLAVATVPGINRNLAQHLADRLNGLEHQGRCLTAYVPLFGEEN